MPRRSSWWGEFERAQQQRRRAQAQQRRFEQQVEREITEQKRRAKAEAERASKASAKEQDEHRRRDGLAAAAEQSEQLEARAQELSELLIRSLRQPVFTVQDMVRPAISPFDPGADGKPEPAPALPQVPDGGVIGRGRRRREAVAAYEEALEAHQQREAERERRLERRRREHQRVAEEEQQLADQQAQEILDGITSAEEGPIESFAAAAINALQLPDGISLQPRVLYRPDPQELVIDIELPEEAIVPAAKSIRYVHTRTAYDPKPRPKTEIHEIYRQLIAQLPLAVLHALFGAFTADVLDAIVINGILDTRDPATGQPTKEFLVSVTTGRKTFDGLILTELNPVVCLQEKLGAKLSRHPYDVEGIEPFLTFDKAKYHLDSSVDIAATLDTTTNLLEIEWSAFEQLVRELLQAMSGGDAHVTRRSRDDGVDGVLFDCDAVMGGEFIVQAKCYRNVVPTNDVRALAGVLHDKRADHAIFVTPSWFSADGRRFADNNRVRLIEGPELKQLLHDHLNLDVVIPGRKRRSQKPKKQG